MKTAPHVLKTAYGTAIPYTRHLTELKHPDGTVKRKGCKYKDSAEFKCRCPKWLYIKPRDGKDDRYSLHTISWAEAMDKATEKLRELDPAIAAAHRLTAKAAQRTPIRQAWQLWLDRTEALYGKIKEDGTKEGTYAGYESLGNRLFEWANQRGILYIEDITTEQLREWYHRPRVKTGMAIKKAVGPRESRVGEKSLDPEMRWWTLAPSTREVSWGKLRSAFAWLHSPDGGNLMLTDPIAPIQPERGPWEFRQGPYSHAQLDQLIEAVKNIAIPNSVVRSEKAIYRERLLSFIYLILNSGCDLVDAVLFEPAAIIEIDTVTAEGAVEIQAVWSFTRVKHRAGTREPVCVVPLEPWLAERLRRVPVSEDYDERMPFRKAGTSVDGNCRRWRERFQACLKIAGIEQVAIPRTRLKEPRFRKANVKQLRHTFVRNELEKNVLPSDLKNEIGHASTELIDLVYGAFFGEVQTEHVTRIVKARNERRQRDQKVVAISSKTGS